MDSTLRYDSKSLYSFGSFSLISGTANTLLNEFMLSTNLGKLSCIRRYAIAVDCSSALYILALFSLKPLKYVVKSLNSSTYFLSSSLQNSRRSCFISSFLKIFLYFSLPVSLSTICFLKLFCISEKSFLSFSSFSRLL